MVFCFAASAQDKIRVPLTQKEYVRALYEVEQNPSKLAALIEAVRVRGLDFELTSGLRSLTKTKTKGDTEIIRTVEEANRRRENPSSAERPSTEESLALIKKARVNTFAALEDMPDFVVKQRIRRSVAYAGTNNFRGLDRLIVAVSYRADGREEYRLLSQNGVLKDDTGAKSSYQEAGGTSSTGEFVTVLTTVFKEDSATTFEFVDTDLLRGRNSLVYDFSITKDKARQQITSYGYIADSTISGMAGRIWIDRKDGRVLRLDSRATEIPGDFPVRSASRLIDYDWVTIGEENYLLPSSSDVRLTFRESRKSYESKNYIEFKDYKKYGTEVLILDDDDEFIDEAETSPKPPPLKAIEGKLPPPLPKT